MDEPIVTFADGARWPALGLGTWGYGMNASKRRAEVAALREAFEIGYRLFDTAEMYGEGGAESALGEALKGALAAGLVRREDVFIVSKVYPHHAAPAAMQRACEASLKRLAVDRIDLYLLHWRGTVPLAETVAGFEALVARGRIARWGVSNFDVADLQGFAALAGGGACAANQVYFSLGQRGPEHSLLPWQQQRRMPLMAYSPLDQGRLLADRSLAAIATRCGATPAQVALAALLALPGVMVIPKSGDAARLRENWGSRGVALGKPERAELDRAFPVPKKKGPLAML